MKWQMMFDRVSTSGDIKDKIVKKFSGIEKYLGRMKDKLDQGFVTLSRGERWGYKVKTILRMPGKEIVAEGRDKTLLSAIDQAYSKIAREARKHAERIKDRRARK